jgi:hypothetical protein
LAPFLAPGQTARCRPGTTTRPGVRRQQRTPQTSDGRQRTSSWPHGEQRVVSRGRPDCWKRPVGWPEGQDALSCPRTASQRRRGHRDGATASTHSRQELGTLGPRRELINGDAVRAVGTGHMSGCDVYDRRFGRHRAPCRRASCLHQGVPACSREPAAAPHTSRAGARRAVSSAGAGMIRPDVRFRPAGSCGLQRLRVVEGLTTSSCLAPCEACPSEQTIRTVRTSLLTALRACRSELEATKKRRLSTSRGRLRTIEKCKLKPTRP